MFADDTSLSCKSSIEIGNKINTDLENVHNWLTANKLTLKGKKLNACLWALNRDCNNP